MLPKSDWPRNRLSQGSRDLKGSLILVVDPMERVVVGPVDRYIRSNSGSFDLLPVPAHIGCHRHHQPVSLANPEGGAGDEPAGCVRADDNTESILLRELSNHLRCARGVLVDKKDDTAVKGLWGQSLGFENDRLLVPVPDQEKRKLNLRLRDVVQPGQGLPVIAALRGLAIDAETYGAAIRGHVAHQAQSSDTATRVAAKINDQSTGCAEPFAKDAGQSVGKVDADESRKQADLDRPD